MGEIVGAGIVSHVPTIMLPEEVRLEINEGKEITLVPGLQRLRTEVLDRVQADTFVLMDTHWEVTFEHIITAHEKREGIFTRTSCRVGCGRSPTRCRATPSSRSPSRRRPRTATTRGCSPPTTRTCRSSTGRSTSGPTSRTVRRSG